MGDAIPNTTFNSINSFAWIGNWEGLDPKKVATLDLKSRYPFLHYVELFTATGGCTAGFTDSHNKSCEPWMDVDAPRLANGTYSWSRLLRVIDNVLAAGFVPYVVTGNVPVSMSANAVIGGFGVNTQLPRDMIKYSRYIQSFAQAALARYGAAALRQWKWGVLTEYNNPSWFSDDGARGYFQLYDWTVCGLRNALDAADAMGKVGAHACTQCGAPSYRSGWDALLLVAHVVNGTNYCTGHTGTQFDFLSNSFYAAVPEDSDPGHLPPWSLRNFAEVMAPLRQALDEAGLTSVSLGVDEGRILSGPRGVSLGGARAVGSAYMAAFDAIMFRQMLDARVEWYSRWAVNTNGQSIARSSPSLDSASTQLARLVHRMAHTRRVRVDLAKSCLGCRPSAYHAATCECGCSRARASSCCCVDGQPPPCLPCDEQVDGLGDQSLKSGPTPGPQLLNASLVDGVVGVSERTGVVWVLLTHFSGALNATDIASVSMELCGLETSSPHTASLTPRTMSVADNNTLLVTTWVVSDSHNTYWAAWTRDVARAMADTNLTWPTGVSRYDETAPASLQGKKGWEWVNSQWSRYRSMTQLSPNASDVAVSVCERGCATLEVQMEPHAVVLFEINRSVQRAE